MVAFAGTAFLQCPLTLDDEAFRQSVQALDTSIIPQGGTALTGAIDAALGAFKDENNFKILVLLSDGEDHDTGALEAAERARLPEEYRREPALALASGGDGLLHTRAILAQAKAHLCPGGLLVVEIGHNRGALERAFPRLPFRWPSLSAGPGYVFVLQREDL